MTSGMHPQHEKLLELAYGELSVGDARRLELHLKGCTRCAEALSAIRRVRQTMSQLPAIQAPDRGMDSLLAYAGQAARRARSGASSTPTWWRRTLLPAAGLIALATVVVVGARVIKVANLSRGASEGDRAEREHRTPMALQAPTSQEERIEAKPALKTGGSDQTVNQHDLRALLYAAAPPSPEAADRDSLGDPASRAGAPKAVPYVAVPQRKAPSDEKKSRIREEPRHLLVQTQARGKERAAEEGGTVGGVPGGIIGGGFAQAPSARLERSGANNEVGEPSTAAAEAKDTTDWRREAVELRRALVAGPRGQERANILSRLCDALYALGERAEAASVCDAVVREFPKSPQATAALRRKALESTAAPAEKIQPRAPSQPAKAKQQSEN